MLAFAVPTEKTEAPVLKASGVLHPSTGPSLVYIHTVARTGPLFLGEFISDLCSSGFRVTFIASPGPELQVMAAEGATTYGIRMEREISPFCDLISLARLWRRLRRIRPDITNVGTPKAGLLGGLAAWLNRVPHRIYTMHTLRLETTRGIKYCLLWCMEWLSCWCAHEVYCVSPSLQQRAVALKLVKKSKTAVVGNGSCNGIDSARFVPGPERKRKAEELRAKLHIGSQAPVIGFVGRFTKDKGIPELYQAFLLLCRDFPELRLLLLGDYESGDAVPSDIRQRMDADKRVLRIGWVKDPAPYYHVLDVFVLPTHREGIGLASLEAQASGVPVVTTNATGARDSIVHGVTGFAVPVGDAAALAAAVGQLLSDDVLRERMGESARICVGPKFDRTVLWSELKQRYTQRYTEIPRKNGTRPRRIENSVVHPNGVSGS